MSAPNHSIAGVCDVELVGEETSDRGRPPDLLIEVPHGATERRHYWAICRQLASPLPESLLDFFFVNTDIGAPECAQRLARRIVASPQGRGRKVLILRSLLPRTFADCNRDLNASRTELASGGFTPAIPDYVTAGKDRQLLAELHGQYLEASDLAHARVCGEGGTSILLHTYAPRSVDVEVDADVGETLRRAYSPQVYEKWPVRPDIDLITETPEGRSLAPRRLVEALREGYGRAGIGVAENATYRIHPGTVAHRHSTRYPGQVLCIEFSRGRLGDPWEPFQETLLSETNVAAMADPLATAWLSCGS